MDQLEKELSSIPHFQFVHEHLFSSGQPNEEQLKSIKAYGIDTIINLAFNDATPNLNHEDRLSAEIGLNYIQVPIDPEFPHDDQCLFVLDLIDHLVKEKMVWIHCTENHQCSSLIYLYRLHYMNMDLPTAHELLHQVWEPNNTWTGLVHAVGLQLQGRKATQELQASLMKAQNFE
ncbi:hypothetical protein [Acinetobacter sp. YH16032]|uniref:hypothetical protein n=1 Tax=Acinetobacter sp. YH16032 TaxID=2601181 RepID=UPI0015D10B23|nr:hypothetical protein [Acinetobacter sp. YH16032]